MVPTDDVVYSELESEYNKEISKGRDELSLNAQSKEPVHSNLESEYDEEIEGQMVDTYIYSTRKAKYNLGSAGINWENSKI